MNKKYYQQLLEELGNSLLKEKNKQIEELGWNNE